MPQVTRTVKAADEITSLMEGPVRATAPKIERIVETLGSPGFMTLPTQLGELMQRLGPLAQLAENAGGLFGAFRMPGMTKPAAPPTPARIPPPRAEPVRSADHPAVRAVKETCRASTKKPRARRPRRRSPTKSPAAPDRQASGRGRRRRTNCATRRRWPTVADVSVAAAEVNAIMSSRLGPAAGRGDSGDLAEQFLDSTLQGLVGVEHGRAVEQTDPPDEHTRRIGVDRRRGAGRHHREQGVVPVMMGEVDGLAQPHPQPLRVEFGRECKALAQGRRHRRPCRHRPRHRHQRGHAAHAVMLAGMDECERQAVGQHGIGVADGVADRDQPDRRRGVVGPDGVAQARHRHHVGERLDRVRD